jgi:hypothetical protein
MLGLASVSKSSSERDLPLGPSWRGFKRLRLKLATLTLLHILGGRGGGSSDVAWGD